MPRLPRFRRSPEIPAFQLTDRDREILKHVHRHRFLRSNHLAALTTGSPQQMLRRLQRLYHHGYLERPLCQIDYYHRGGSRTIAYGLGNKGAHLLKRELKLPYHRLNWPAKSKVQRLFLEHALLVSDVMVAVELSCHNCPGIRMLTADDLPKRPGQKRGPFQWKVDLGRGRVCSMIPDCVFGLEFTDKPPNQRRIWFCLEADRGTMPISRSDPHQTSYHRKLLGYAATWSHGLHQKLFGSPRFRVLTFATNPDRLDSLRAACRSLPSGHGLFLFAAAGGRHEPDLLSSRWQTCRQGETTLLSD